jgi:hypothetical protein
MKRLEAGAGKSQTCRASQWQSQIRRSSSGRRVLSRLIIDCRFEIAGATLTFDGFIE